MNSILNIVGKPVLSLYDCEIEGTLNNFWLDKNCKKIKWLSIYNEEENEEKYLDILSIYSIGDDAIVIKNKDCLAKQSEIDFSLNYLSPINHSIYNTKGTYLGKIKDIEIDEKFAIQNYCSENEKFSIKAIAKCGENIVIIQDKQSSIKIPQNKENLNINTLSKTNQMVFAMPLLEQEKIPIPAIITTKNYNFLLGRKATKNIYSSSNEIIIKKGTKITEKHLESARKNSKLRELTLISV